MEPDGEGDRRGRTGDLEVTGGIEEVRGCAIVVDESAHRRAKEREVLEEGKEV